MSGLRIIAGKARGKRLKTVPGDSTRPITDRTKESLFNIISGDIQNSTFLDMFAGTGSVGIEALSRGAAFTRFIENNRKAISTIRTNLEICGFAPGNDGEFSEVIHGDAYQVIGGIPNRQFDYVYIAPPQYKDMWKRAILLLDKNPEWLSPDAWVIVQIHPVEYEEIKATSFHEFMQRKYGSTLLIFYCASF